MNEDPTLKIRLRLPGTASHWGHDCHAVAGRMFADTDYEVLDAKWGRPPTKWEETGGGWGRQHLSEYERGVVAALAEQRDDDTNVGRLLRIVDRLTS